ncbi:MAG: succinylglutamate desuccinylase/aspartoacylase family protein [Alphaproteobacteria bacterium]|nr:succinylglutamate desuccinylase/aspartoacylase family protein [Alphaproteobacteria bacterium]MCB9791880.1 succinylglutamate desuccinylase/aspartoacylase family protein [Alphaproteobacteria bacterium]
MTELFRMQAPFRGDYTLRSVDIGEGSPKVALVAGLHGNELNGVHALNLVSRSLRFLKLRGSVRLIPVVNTFGLDQGTKRWPVDDRDINQAFPGSPDGAAVERIAHAVLQATEADVCVDVHSGSPLVREIPQVRVPLSGRELTLARAMQLPMTWRREGDRIEATGLVGAWREAGRAALHVVGGQGGTLDVSAARQIADGLLRLLCTLGMVRQTVDDGAPLVDTTRRGVGYHYSATGGFWVPEVRVGDRVEPGHVLGTLHEVIGGEVLDQVRARQQGFVVTMRTYPVVHARELLVRVAEPKP